MLYIMSVWRKCRFMDAVFVQCVCGMFGITPWSCSISQWVCFILLFTIIHLTLDLFFFSFSLLLFCIIISLLKILLIASLASGYVEMYFFVESQNISYWIIDKLLICTAAFNKKFCSICSVASGGTNVHFPMGGFEWLGPEIIRAIISGLSRILHLCQVL